MNKDYSYCSGVTCPIRNECKRYLPDPPDVPLWWIPPAYKENLKQCPHFEKTYRNNNNPELLKGGEERNQYLMLVVVEKCSTTIKMTKGSYSKTYETYPPTYVMDDCLK